MATKRRKLNAWELNALDEALKRGDTIQDLASRYNTDVDHVRSILSETGLTLPEQGQQVTRLDDDERTAYIDALTNGYNANAVAEKYNVSGQRVVDTLRGAGLVMPLIEDHQTVYDAAQSIGMGPAGVADAFGVDQSVVDTLLGAAGVSLSGTPKKPKPKPKPITGNTTPITDGLPDYNSDISNMLGSIPQLPGLRMVRRRARRQDDPNWRGTTDTILTSGRGVTTPADTRMPLLSGS